MGLLEAALPQVYDNTPKVKSDNGIYKGFFLGLSDPFEYVSTYPGENCRLCKNNPGRGRGGEGVCAACNGTKKRTEQHIKLIYKLENGETEEEEVNFKVSPPGTGKDGSALSPTTLFVRLRSISGLKQPTPEELDRWYSSLPSPIKIPITVIIEDNSTGKASKFTSVQLRAVGSQQKPAEQFKPEPKEEPEDDGGFVDGSMFDE